MSDPADLPPAVEGPPLERPDSMTSRRRLLRGGLAAAPVLMTLVSRPVLAQVCTTPSGYVSANASTAGRGVACTGHTPTYWATPQNFSDWPSGFKATNPQGTRFNDQFSPSLQGNPLLSDVLASSSNNVARYVSAALLNSAKGLTPPLGSPAVKDIWSEWASTGQFSPSSGAFWDENEIIAYLLTTIS